MVLITPNDPETIAAYVEGVERQLEQLRQIILAGEELTVNSAPTSAPKQAKDGEDEDGEGEQTAAAAKAKALEEENQKLKYRIKILLRTVAEKQARIEELEK
ncbi:hypothetical protein HDU96_006721 [Phlyctochytrium bullatum]|nr:hypothetical protein HDU96_006721 [Phlyctochytrium bullatum]